MASTFNQPPRRTPQQNETTSTDQPLSMYVRNLSFNTVEEDLQRFFNEQCGDVTGVRIIYDNYTRSSRGFGFVYFGTEHAFNTALALQSCRIDGRDLRLAPAASKKSSSSTTSAAPVAVVLPGTNRRQTQVVHCKKSNYDIYIGRPSDWGNPFVIGKDGDRADVIRKYRAWIMRQPDLLARVKKELRGQRIACWCKPEACHGDILAEIADAD